MAECYCDYCVTVTTIVKRHVESTRRVRADKRTEATVLKEYGVDLKKAREEAAGNMAYTSRTGYDEATLSMLARAGLPLAANKSALPGAASDPNWDRLLAVHAAAAAGDPSAMSAWAAIEGLDPGAARLVPHVARARRPEVTKVRKSKALNKALRSPATGGRVIGDASDPEFDEFVGGLVRSGAVDRDTVRKALGSAPGPLPDFEDDPGFAAFKAAHGQGRALNKAAGSQAAPTSHLERVEDDPEFGEFMRSIERARGVRF